MTADPPRLDRSGYRLALDERFTGPTLDETTWIPHYLPHWASLEATRARYDVGGGSGGSGGSGLRLRIDADQAPWSQEWNGAIRVSNLQTGVGSGPVGSREGQHRFRADLVVREAQPHRRLFTPQYGIVELRARALADPTTLCALWLIGIEDTPEHSAEICLMEVFGRDIDPMAGTTRVGLGVHPFGDPAIHDDFEQVTLPIDAREPHTYSAEWLPDRVRFHVDDVLVRVVRQSPAYPMQLMLNIYELPDGSPPSPPEAYPKVFDVEWVRAWRPRNAEPGPEPQPPAD